jgi:hypothetical protein
MMEEEIAARSARRLSNMGIRKITNADWVVNIGKFLNLKIERRIWCGILSGRVFFRIWTIALRDALCLLQSGVML